MLQRKIKRLAASTVAWIVLTTASARAGTNLVNLFSFDDPINGYAPGPALVPYPDGSLYGIASSGGAHGAGTAFRMAPDGTVTVLVAFDITNGVAPSGLILARDGNFYGTTMQGGVSNNGTIFRMTPGGVLTVLDSFTGTNGQFPLGLIQATNGSFYGTTTIGGAYGIGSVFEMSPDGTLHVLMSFDRTNGFAPNAGLLQASDGNFYGTTREGGSVDGGSAFRLTPSGEITNLVSFNGSNGYWPSATLMQAADGNLYGTTAGMNDGTDGTLFRLTTNGALTTLVNFNGTNGSFCFSTLIQANDGNLYGTTERGGPSSIYGPGTIFKIAPDGSFATVYAFTGTNDGVYPAAMLTQASDGNLYGVTTEGGSFNSGNIFRLSLPMAPVLKQPVVGNGTVNLSWTSVAGQTYQIEYCSDLTTLAWNPVGSPILATSGVTMTTDLPGSDQQRFYRVAVLP